VDPLIEVLKSIGRFFKNMKCVSACCIKTDVAIPVKLSRPIIRSGSYFSYGYKVYLCDITENKNNKIKRSNTN
jgi:hypothetical protein